MKAIIHIGAAKTGSTTIQSFLRVNEPALAAQGFHADRVVEDLSSQFGFAVVGCTLGGQEIPAQDLARRRLNIEDMNDQQAFTERFLADFAQLRAQWGSGTYVASSEHIAAWLKTPQSVAALDRVLRGMFDEVRYVHYIRSQVELICSSYSERLKRGEALTLDQHIEDRMRHNHFRVAQRWADTVGRDRYALRLMTPDMLHQGDLIADFCKVTGMDRASLSVPDRQNEALSHRAAAIMSRVNRLVTAFDDRGHRTRAHDRALRLAQRIGGTGSPIRLNAEQAARVHDACSESNERLRDMFFPERERLFDAGDGSVR